MHNHNVRSGDPKKSQLNFQCLSSSSLLRIFYKISKHTTLPGLAQSTMSSSAQLSKTDSEVSSLTPSSPARSSPPRRPVYYVQSPSRDSHDGEKTTNSFHSTPVLSPMGSPPHSHSNSSLGPHSRESSSTRFSASLKPHKQHKSDGSNRKGRKPWKEFDAIEEEGLLGDGIAPHGMTRRCYFLSFVVGFCILFSLFSLILWGASRPQKPTITMKAVLKPQCPIPEYDRLSIFFYHNHI